MTFKPFQGYNLRFFSTGIPSSEMDPHGEEIITAFPEYMIRHVFDRIDEGFVIIQEVPPAYVGIRRSEA